MFRSRSMRRVALVIPERSVVDVTEALAILRVFHIADPEDMGEGQPKSSSWIERANTYTSLAQRIVDLMALLGVEEGNPPSEPLGLIAADIVQRDVDALEQEARALVSELQEAKRKLEDLHRVRAQVMALSGVNVDLEEFREMRYLHVLLGTMPSENIGRLETSLEHVPSAVIVLGQAGNISTVALCGLKRDIAILNRAARSAFLNVLELPEEAYGYPEKALAGIEEGIRRTQEQIAAFQNSIRQLHRMRVGRLQHLLWRVRASQRIVQTIARYRPFRYTYLALGWVPSSQLATFKEHIAQIPHCAVVEVQHLTAKEWAEAPFEFDNPPVVRLFERLVVIYDYPRYNELDPTPLVALTFPLLYGAMFGDVGHGLFLVLLGILLLSRRVKSLASVAEWGGIITACGAAATLFGFLYGSLFGFEDVIRPLWLSPSSQVFTMMMVPIGFGAVILSLGMVLYMVNAAIRRNWGDLLLGRNGVAGMVFYWAFLGLGMSLTQVRLPFSSAALFVVIGVSAALLMLKGWLLSMIGGVETEEALGMGMTLMEGVFEFYEAVLSLISNTLSYVRLGAFAIAHSALGLLVFILAKMLDPGHGVGYWIVVVLGNLGIIGLEGVIVAIQSMRLEYYEFFSKFFGGGGERYRPLTLVAGEEA